MIHELFQDAIKPWYEQVFVAYYIDHINLLLSSNLMDITFTS